MLLAGAAEPATSEDISSEEVWPLLGIARRHFRILSEILSSRAGVPLTLTLPVGPDIRSLHLILRREEILRKETLQLIGKIQACLDQDQALMEKLSLIRKDLLDSKSLLKNTA